MQKNKIKKFLEQLDWVHKNPPLHSFHECSYVSKTNPDNIIIFYEHQIMIRTIPNGYIIKPYEDIVITFTEDEFVMGYIEIDKDVFYKAEFITLIKQKINKKSHKDLVLQDLISCKQTLCKDKILWHLMNYDWVYYKKYNQDRLICLGNNIPKYMLILYDDYMQVYQYKIYSTNNFIIIGEEIENFLYITTLHYNNIHINKHGDICSTSSITYSKYIEKLGEYALQLHFGKFKLELPISSTTIEEFISEKCEYRKEKQKYDGSYITTINWGVYRSYTVDNVKIKFVITSQNGEDK